MQQLKTWVLTAFVGATPGFYVDVSARHARRFSDAYMFYKQEWRGMNIEPNSIVIDEFRRARPRAINLSAGDI